MRQQGSRFATTGKVGVVRDPVAAVGLDPSTCM
jgi:hypothetical protein